MQRYVSRFASEDQLGITGGGWLVTRAASAFLLARRMNAFLIACFHVNRLEWDLVILC